MITQIRKDYMSKKRHSRYHSSGTSCKFPEKPTMECKVAAYDPVTGTIKTISKIIDGKLMQKAYSNGKPIADAMDIVIEDIEKQGFKVIYSESPVLKVAKDLSAKVESMPKDKDWPVIFMAGNCTKEQFRSLGFVKRTHHCNMMQNFIQKEFHGRTVADIQVSPGHQIYHCLRNQQKVADYVKDSYLSIPENRDDIKAKAKIAAENRKLLDQYLEMLDFTTISLGFDEMGYQMVRRICPMSADDFVAAEYLLGIMFYGFSSRAFLQVYQAGDGFGDYCLFTEDKLLSWIDEIEAAEEATGTGVS